MSRKNLKINEDTYDELKEEKRKMETWDSYLRDSNGKLRTENANLAGISLTFPYSGLLLR